MELSTDPGSPQLRTAIERPLTIGEWSLLRPFITYAYKKKQLTARTILKELSQRGFYVTDKLLRTRFKTWGIDDKNKRKDKNSSVGHPKRRDRASISSENNTNRYRTHATSAGSITGQYLWTNDDAQQSFDECTQSEDQLFPVSAAAIQTKSIPQSLNSAQQLQRQRLIGAVANWCDHLSSLNDVVPLEPSPHWPIAELFRKLDYGLSLVEKDIHAGRKLLRQAGTEVSPVLQSKDPGLVTDLLVYCIWWRRWMAEKRTCLQHASVIITFLVRTSHHDLGVAHPVTLLIDILAREPITPDLCDMLCMAIDLKYVRRLRDDTPMHYKASFRHIFGSLLIAQKRYLDVENWFARYSADRKFLNATADDDVWALGTLSLARARRGSYPEAETALSQAMICLRKNGSYYSNSACHIMRVSAMVKWFVSEWASYERLLLEHMRIAQIIGNEVEKTYAVSQMWHYYKSKGRLDLAAQLSETYPDILDN